MVYSPIFLVPKSGPRTPDDTYRLIVDLRGPNRALQTPKFRIQDLYTIRYLLFQGWYATSVDITKAYYHVPLAPSLQRVCAFAVGHRRFQCRALPFGISPAPYILTQLMSAALAPLRRTGVVVVVYLDYLLVLAPSAAVCLQHTQQVVRWLTRLGFQVSASKSLLSPTQSLVYLGMTLDLARGQFQLPRERASRVYTALWSLSVENRERRHSLRDIQRVLGLAASTLLAVPDVLDELRPAYRWVAKLVADQPRLVLDRFAHRANLRLPRKVFEPLERLFRRFWDGMMANSLCAPFVDLTRSQILLASDASRVGWGGAWPAQRKTVGGKFQPNKLSGHPFKVSTAELELYAALKTLQTAAKHWLSPPTQLAPSGLDSPGWHFGASPASTSGSSTGVETSADERVASKAAPRPQLSVTLLVDNLAAVLMLQGKGSKSPPCQRLCRRIRRLVRKENWHLRVHWTTTEANLLADALSRGRRFCPLPQFHPWARRTDHSPERSGARRLQPLPHQESPKSSNSISRQEREQCLRAFPWGVPPELFRGPAQLHPLSAVLAYVGQESLFFPPTQQVPFALRWLRTSSTHRTFLIVPDWPGAWWFPLTRPSLFGGHSWTLGRMEFPWEPSRPPGSVPYRYRVVVLEPPSFHEQVRGSKLDHPSVASYKHSSRPSILTLCEHGKKSESFWRDLLFRMRRRHAAYCENG